MSTFRFGNIILLLLLISSCQTRDKVEQSVRQNADTCYYRLMEGEANLVGEYMRKQDFNSGLKFECRQPELHPYPSLFRIIDSLRTIHDLVLDSRGNYYVAQDSRLKRVSFYNKEDLLLLGRDLDLECAKAQNQLQEYNAMFWEQAGFYDDLCAEFGIVRITHGEYADSLLSRLMMWEDSLEQQGRWIGEARSTLKESGLEPLGESYQYVYTPVSQMEKLHKDFQAQLLLVENQHGRYDSSRQDEYYYKGPHLVERHDVDKTEDEVKELAAMQLMFNELRLDYNSRRDSLGLR